MTEQFYVVTKLSRIGSISVVTKLATTESLVAHDRARCARQACACDWDESTTYLRARKGNPIVTEKFFVAAGAW